MGVLIALLIIKYVIEVRWILNPIFIIIKTIFIPMLLGGVLYYISEPLQRFMEKKELLGGQVFQRFCCYWQAS